MAGLARLQVCSRITCAEARPWARAPPGVLSPHMCRMRVRRFLSPRGFGVARRVNLPPRRTKTRGRARASPDVPTERTDTPRRDLVALWLSRGASPQGAQQRGAAWSRGGYVASPLGHPPKSRRRRKISKSGTPRAPQSLTVSPQHVWTSPLPPFIPPLCFVGFGYPPLFPPYVLRGLATPLNSPPMFCRVWRTCEWLHYPP